MRSVWPMHRALQRFLLQCKASNATRSRLPMEHRPTTHGPGNSPPPTTSTPSNSFAHLGGIRNRGTAMQPLDISYRLWELSAAVPVGSGQLLAGWASRRTGDAVVPVPATAAGGNLVRKVLTVGYDHQLSKRTDAYLVLMRDQTRTQTTGAPSQVLEARGTSVALGVRHRF